jgi:hypothetical protein
LLGVALVLLTLAALICVLTAPARGQQAPSHSGHMHEQIPSFTQLFKGPLSLASSQIVL